VAQRTDARNLFFRSRLRRRCSTEPVTAPRAVQAEVGAFAFAPQAAEFDFVNQRESLRQATSPTGTRLRLFEEVISATETACAPLGEAISATQTAFAPLQESILATENEKLNPEEAIWAIEAARIDFRTAEMPLRQPKSPLRAPKNAFTK